LQPKHISQTKNTKTTQTSKTAQKPSIRGQHFGTATPCSLARPCYPCFPAFSKQHSSTAPQCPIARPCPPPSTPKQPTSSLNTSPMSSRRSQERVDELEAQVKYLQTQLGQLMEEKRRWNQSPSHSRTHVDSDESEREEKSYHANSSYEEDFPRRHQRRQRVVLVISELTSRNSKANSTRITS